MTAYIQKAIWPDTAAIRYGKVKVVTNDSTPTQPTINLGIIVVEMTCHKNICIKKRGKIASLKLSPFF